MGEGQICRKVALVSEELRCDLCGQEGIVPQPSCVFENNLNFPMKICYHTQLPWSCWGRKTVHSYLPVPASIRHLGKSLRCKIISVDFVVLDKLDLLRIVKVGAC